MVPKAGLEPARASSPPPQDGVSTNSTTSAYESHYLLGAGAGPGFAAGGAGTLVNGASGLAGWVDWIG